ncbi:acyl dehydratase [Crossiella equi]|uniref:Acyl dehydratase n=1 Tax=Crossiella equi TaxID=130796 RepID=A0ABS5AIN5_9PSEU|nr:acyl dehydratase [Crossiella equi]
MYEVGRESIRDLAYAIGDLNRAYRDPEVAKSFGHSDVIATPTFATVLAVRSHHVVTDDPELGMDYSRMMHSSQRFINHRAIKPGDRLICELHVDDISFRMGNDYITLRSELLTEDGEAISTAIATLIVRGEKPTGAEGEASA